MNQIWSVLSIEADETCLKPLTCCKVCWVHLSSSSHSLCLLDGMWPGCSSHPISGISSCKRIKEKAVRSKWGLNGQTTAHQLPTHHRVPQIPPGRRSTRLNLGLNVPQFSLRPHYFGNTKTKKPQNVICNNLATDYFQEVTWHLLLCHGNPSGMWKRSRPTQVSSIIATVFISEPEHSVETERAACQLAC